MKRTVGGDFVHGSVAIGNDEPARYAAYAQFWPAPAKGGSNGADLMKELSQNASASGATSGRGKRSPHSFPNRHPVAKRLGPSKRRTVAHVELPAEAPADDASSDDGEETWSPSQAPTGAEINHSNQARARRSRPMPPAPRAGGLVRMRKAKRIKEVTTPYLCKASIKRALLTALQIEADKAEVCPQGPAQVCCIASHVNFIFANDIGPHR